MKDKVALVTGGMGGIGEAIAKRLHDEGARVAISYNKGGNHDIAKAWQAIQMEVGYHFSIHYVDVANFDSAENLVREVEEEHGQIDILVNNAGITQDVTLRKMSLEQWNKVISTDLNSIFNVTRHVINGMLSRHFGRIINISSINGEEGQLGQTNYAAAKAGMYGFTKALAKEVARKNITVNTISPGYIKTVMTDSVNPEVMERIIANIPVGRLGRPEEIADAVAFLANERASYITGTNLSVNGGQHM